MIEYKLSLASSGAVKTPGSMDALQLGYSRNCGVYRLRVSAADEWKGMTLRAFWHTPGGSPPASLVEDGVVEVPALVTAVPGEGCITFEGSDGVRTLTSADLRYRVAANSGTEDGHSAAAGHSGMAAAGGSAGRGRCRRGEERCAGRDGPEQRVGQRCRCGPQPEDSARGHRLGKLQGRERRPRCTGRTKARRATQARRGRKAKKAIPARQAPPVRPARKARGARRARRERRRRWMPPSPCQAQRQMPRSSAARWPGKPLPAILTATPVLPRRAVRPTVSTDSPLRPRRPTPVQAAALPPA